MVAKDLGGHSRFSFTSSFVESPVVCEITLELREAPGAGRGPEETTLLVWFSNRPIRLATLARGRSSGRGIGAIESKRRESENYQVRRLRRCGGR